MKKKIIIIGLLVLMVAGVAYARLNVATMGVVLAGGGFAFTPDTTWDFETGDLTGWTVDQEPGSHTISITSANALSGTYGLETEGIDGTGYSARIYRSIDPTYTDIGARVLLKLHTDATCVNSGISAGFYPMQLATSTAFNSVGNTYTPLINYVSANTWVIKIGGTQVKSLDRGTEYELIWRFVVDATEGGAELWVDGEKVHSDLAHDTSSTTSVGWISTGWRTAGSTPSIGTKVFFDDLQVGTITQ